MRRDVIEASLPRSEKTGWSHSFTNRNFDSHSQRNFSNEPNFFGDAEKSRKTISSMSGHVVAGLATVPTRRKSTWIELNDLTFSKMRQCVPKIIVILHFCPESQSLSCVNFFRLQNIDSKCNSENLWAKREIKMGHLKQKSCPITRETFLKPD